MAARPLRTETMIHGWNIRCTTPAGVVSGRALPVFHGPRLSTLAVYADGVIQDGAEPVGLEKLRRRIAGRPVCPRDRLRVLGLGQCGIREPDWWVSPEDLVDRVAEALAALSASAAGATACAEPAGARSASYGRDPTPYRRGRDGREIPGDQMPVFVAADDGAFALTRWFVFADGWCVLGADDRLVAIDEVAMSFDRGVMATSVPDGTLVEVDGLGRFRTTAGRWGGRADQFVIDARDRLAMLNGAPGSIELCRRAFTAYRADPSEANRSRLRSAYEAVATHRRWLCGELGQYDWPIQRIVYDDERCRPEVRWLDRWRLPPGLDP